MPGSIGTLNEKPLHASLKRWYAKPGDRMEAPVGGFTVDIARDDLLIEIQTRNLSSIKRKLSSLVEKNAVMLVYPIALEKWILRQFPDGRFVPGRRKSPKRGTIESLFEELVSIAGLMAHPNFSLLVALTHEEHVRRIETEPGKWRTGWSLSERRLLKVVGQRLFRTPGDIMELIPAGLMDPFTTHNLSEAIGQPLWLTQKMVYCLRKMGMVTAAGKSSRWVLYVRQDHNPVQ